MIKKNPHVKINIFINFLLTFFIFSFSIYAKENISNASMTESIYQCNLGKHNYCIRAGIIALEKNKVTKSATYFTKACSSKFSEDCKMLTTFESLNILTCEYGFYSGCIVSSELSFQEKDYDNQIKYLDKACKLGSLSSCDDLASAYSTGIESIIVLSEKFPNSNYLKTDSLAKHVHKNIKLSIKYYRLMCESESKSDDVGAACYFLFRYYNEGIGTPKSPKQAKKYLQKACEIYPFSFSIGQNIPACPKK